jgi:hypothetical protein
MLRANQQFRRRKPLSGTFTPFSTVGVKVFFCALIGAGPAVAA